MALHYWIPTNLGHGDAVCKWCRITDREAAVLGILNECKNNPNTEEALSMLDKKIKAIAQKHDPDGLSFTARIGDPLRTFGDLRGTITEIKLYREKHGNWFLLYCGDNLVMALNANEVASVIFEDREPREEQ